MINHLYKTIFIFILIAVQSSCGFYLRGEVELSDTVTPIFIEVSGADNEFQRDLEILLSGLGENVLAGSMAEAKTWLIVSSIQKKQRVVTVDNLGRVREYELNYQFNYQLKKNIGSGLTPEIIKSNVIKLKRDLLFDPDNVIAVSHEKKTLYDDMRKDAARVVLRQLMAIK